MTSNEDRLLKKVMRWAPVGTSGEEAKRLMETHGFRCSPSHLLEASRQGDLPVVECRRTNHIINRVWVVRLYLKEDRVTASQEQIFNDPLRLFEDMH